MAYSTLVARALWADYNLGTSKVLNKHSASGLKEVQHGGHGEPVS